MAKVIFEHPVLEMVGTINRRRDADHVMIYRIRKNGIDRLGNPVPPTIQSYIYHKHQGEWSPAVQACRERFKLAQRQARAELSDPERKAYWETRYEDHRKNCAPDEKFYKSILGFVSSRILADLKKDASA